MTRTPFALHEPDLSGARVLLVGLGKSGAAALRLLAARGARVLAVDRRSEAELGGVADEALRLGAELRGGGYDAADAESVELIVVSPGVPRRGPLFERAAALTLPVWGEIELAARFCRGRVIGITGSNGKSTVTALAGNMLRRAGIAGGTGGNLDTPFADLLEHDGPDAVHAVELSSFQLETVEAFRAAVAVLLNVTPDHLDRYDSFEDYAAAKARLFEGQRADDAVVVNEDDPHAAALAAATRGTRYGFSTRRELVRGACLVDGALTLRTSHGEERLLDAAALPIPGEHNVSNALAAALACRLCDCPVEAIAGALREFDALPHRLQRVAERNGVAYYDDSKATNVDAARRAIEAFPDDSLHLILGGRDKGADWSGLADAVARRARAVYLIGEAAPAIERAFAGRISCASVETLDRAVRGAFDAAAPGQVVLLSPACASFDQYRSFEERGRHFAQLVAALPQEPADA